MEMIEDPGEKDGLHSDCSLEAHSELPRKKQHTGRLKQAAGPQTGPLQCPTCGGRKLWHAGLRYLSSGKAIQRMLCRECGHRFSLSPGAFKRAQKGPATAFNRPTSLLLDCRGSDERDARAGGTRQVLKNLVATEIEKQAVAGRPPPDRQALKGKLLEFEFWMQKQGYAESTVENRLVRLSILARRGANIMDPESVKAVIALQKNWSDGNKANVVDAYTCFLEKEGLTWDPPKYTRLETIPFIPSEAELNQLIGSCGKVLGTFLQGLKETGADPGELAAITCKDISEESRTITLNHPVKGHRPRILSVSAELIRRLQSVTSGTERLFDDFILRRAFYYKRKTTAKKLSNPKLLDITFITFRHWFGTTEYHRTKDILHVQRLLGHKNIQNTLIYIDLEAKLFNGPNDGFTSRVALNAGEACSLIEAGFEYVTGEYNDGGKLFRKRL